MNTNFNLRLDENLKAQSFGVIESFGLTPSQFMRLILKQVADTGSFPLWFERGTEAVVPIELTAQAIRQGRLDYQAGVLDRFEPTDAIEAIQALSRG